MEKILTIKNNVVLTNSRMWWKNEKIVQVWQMFSMEVVITCQHTPPPPPRPFLSPSIILRFSPCLSSLAPLSKTVGGTILLLTTTHSPDDVFIIVHHNPPYWYVSLTPVSTPNLNSPCWAWQHEMPSRPIEASFYSPRKKNLVILLRAVNDLSVSHQHFYDIGRQ